MNSGIQIFSKVGYMSTYDNEDLMHIKSSKKEGNYLLAFTDITLI